MPNPALLYYTIENQIGISKGASSFIVLVSDGHTARRAELKVANNQDPDVKIQQRLNQLWQTGADASMQDYRVATQRNDNPLLNDLIDAISFTFATHATPSASMIFEAAETVIQASTPRHDEWLKLTNMLKSMSDDERLRYLALIILITQSKSQMG